MYLFFVGLSTFKDTFWSSKSNPDHPFYYDCMIGENVVDPNVPWTVTYRYNGPHSRTSMYVMNVGGNGKVFAYNQDKS